MSILSLSVAVQTQACAGTKVAMRNPVNIADLSQVDRDARRTYEKYEADLKRLGIASPITDPLVVSRRDKEGNTLLHRVAQQSKSNLTFERTWMEILRLLPDKSQIRPLLLQTNNKGYSVLAVAVLSKQLKTFEQVLNCTKQYLEPKDFSQIDEALHNLLRNKTITRTLFFDCRALLPLAEKENQSEGGPSAPLLLPPPPPPFPTTMHGVSARRPEAGPPLGPIVDLNAELLASFKKKRRAKKSHGTPTIQQTAPTKKSHETPTNQLYDVLPTPRPVEPGVLQPQIKALTEKFKGTKDFVRLNKP